MEIVFYFFPLLNDMESKSVAFIQDSFVLMFKSDSLEKSGQLCKYWEKGLKYDCKQRLDILFFVAPNPLLPQH